MPTCLSAFIDCHSRYVVEARYYFRQNLDVLIDSLIRAWSNHGASLELYLDNAKVCHANGLKAACYRLRTRLLHRPPRDPAPGGLIERFIIVERRPWPFHQFASTVAHLLGFKAGLTALCSGDLEALKKVYHQSSSIDRQMVKKAFENAPQPTVLYIVAELKQLIKGGRSCS